MLTYPNTPEAAREIGWNQVPEYCRGNPDLPYVRHDFRKGTFTFTDEEEPD